MSIEKACSNYFRGFQGLFGSASTKKERILGGLKVLSYLTFVIPLGMLAVYGGVALHNRRIRQKSGQAPKDTKTASAADFALKHLSKSKRPSQVGPFDAAKPRVVKAYAEFLDCYKPVYRPTANAANLEAYSNSEDCERHKRTACVYYNGNQLSKEDAKRVVYQREPTNIAMGENQYNREQLKEKFGYEQSVFNTEGAVKENGQPFKDLPCTAAIYSETFLWNPPGGNQRKEVAVLSLPAPALDTDRQPHYNYYMSEGHLDADKYSEEMQFLFDTVERAIKDHLNVAFQGNGLKRIVLCRFGQASFLLGLANQDRIIANRLFQEGLNQFLKRMREVTHLPIVMSEYSQNVKSEGIDMLHGDIVQTAEEGDFIVNAWDPHSAAGNGNDNDHSFDGAIGKATGVGITQSATVNPRLHEDSAFFD